MEVGSSDCQSRVQTGIIPVWVGVAVSRPRSNKLVVCSWWWREWSSANMWWRRQCKIPSAQSTECMLSTTTLLQTLWRMSWGLELLLHLLSYLQQERESYYCCSHPPPSTPSNRLSTLRATQSLCDIKVCKTPRAQDSWQIALWRFAPRCCTTALWKEACGIYHPLYSWARGKFQVGQVTSLSINSIIADHRVTKH